jgi:glycerophosphoryl diester phosphodiesterase
MLAPELELSEGGTRALASAPLSRRLASSRHCRLGATGLLLYVAGVLTALLLAPSENTGATDTPGWLVERLFHADGATYCPWTTEPSTDFDCLERRSRTEVLRSNLSTCAEPLASNPQTYGHRGAPLVAPEETMAAWSIAVQGGAGAIECDVAVTSDLDFVCRHGVCDLATTTDILRRPELAARCSTPFSAASGAEPAAAECCAYDFTADELETLCATMEAETDPTATSAEAWLRPGSPAFRSPYLARESCHRVVRFSHFLAAARAWRVSVVPELKGTWTAGLDDFLRRRGHDRDWLADSFASALASGGFSSPLGSRADLNAAARRGTLGLMQTFDSRVALRWKATRPTLPVLYLWASPPAGANASSCSRRYSDCGASELLTELLAAGVEVLAPSLFVRRDRGLHHSISARLT